MERIPRKLYYKIGEVCDLCKIEPHVLRYWETEFSQLSPSKNNSGQRVYRYRDVQVVQRIKQLLYEEGYTIAGANKKLATEKFDFDKETLAAVSAESGARRSLEVPESSESASAETLPSAAGSISKKASSDPNPKELLKEIRSELKSVLEILSSGRPGPRRD